MTGRLFVVGLGPGDYTMLTGQAQAALQAADVIIGYTGYVTWVEPLLDSQERLALPLTQETERARLAVERLLQGAVVCVISSGDAGIYGMASLIFEVLAQHGAEALLSNVVVIPGISAINACAALLGAPLGHDFAVISLSDLLTPWERIERRLAAAADADFVTVLLNPKSARRHWQYARAQDILAQRRVPTTPVGIVRNAYRPEQAIAITTVAAMGEAHVDMLTTVIVGNSQTRRFQTCMVTPRGYTLAEAR
jgi:precorrin-3B C17-methyltransferase